MHAQYNYIVCECTVCYNMLCNTYYNTTCLVALQLLYAKDLPTEVNIWQVGMYLGGGGGEQ